ncbi:MAG: DUF3592 domain-containing protein [Pseudomonadota bacterium]
MRIFNIPYKAFITGLTSLLILGGMGWIEIVNRPILAALEREGVPATAEITEMVAFWHLYRTVERPFKRVYYVFTTADGQEVEGSRTQTKSEWRRLRIGGPVEVVYLPDRPHIHSASISHGYAGRWMIWLLLPLMLLCAGLSRWYWRRNYTGPPRLWPPIQLG